MCPHPDGLNYHVVNELLMNESSRIIMQQTVLDELLTEQDPMGPSRDRSLLHILCFSSSLKDLDNSI